jgi:hypothetical protein
MPRTLLEIQEARMKDMVELEAVYQCVNIGDVSKCFAILHFEVTSSIQSIAGEEKGLKTRRHFYAHNFTNITDPR